MLSLNASTAYKENMPSIPKTGKAVTRQQFLLNQALEDWIVSIKG